MNKPEQLCSKVAAETQIHTNVSFGGAMTGQQLFDDVMRTNRQNAALLQELIAFAKKVHAHPAVPASLHDQAARILEMPSLAHGEADNE